VALKLKRLGISRVYPMEGGIEAWTEAGYETEMVGAQENSLE
jgi:rhodanese-related sulfurtransferase